MQIEDQGLTSDEVRQRQEQGLQNNYSENATKTTKAIFYDNILTLFNLLNLLIGICLFLVGAYSNLFFMIIIMVNIAIGIYQEIHARNMVQKLSIVARQSVQVIRDGRQMEVDSTEVVMDDLIIVGAGDQIPTDMIVVEGQAEANESLLTGESDLVTKLAGDTLLSGSFLSSGEAKGKVLHVGAENYAVKLADEAKVHKPFNSELVRSIRKISKFTSLVIIPLGALLFIEAYVLRASGIKESVIVSAAALLGMLPKGLVLLISIALTTGVTKLAKKRILVQDMYSIETLAHVDTLCLDKTGTITEGKMRVNRIHEFHPFYQKELTAIIGSYLAESKDNNVTMQALREYFSISDRYKADEITPFSSDRKWGAAEFAELGTVYLGAPEKLLAVEQLPEEVMLAQQAGFRVLLLAIAPDKSLSAGRSKLEPLAIFEIEDIIRQNAEETLAYLHNEGVDLKVISGDNPVTVSNIARRAGLPDYEKYVDLSACESEDEVRQSVREYTVFGRVTPQQKKILVQELKNSGRTVAMTGDGVNDVLALREADVSIAMAEGDGATRQIANLVLLDSDFTTLPEVVFEGRRVVNNVTKVSGIFFIKTIYSFILSLICILTVTAFPFIPIQITLIDLAIEGYPSFFLSFEQDKKKITGHFLKTALTNALPNAFLVIINVIAVDILATQQQWGELDKTTLMYYLLIGISCLAVIKACIPFNPLRSFLAITTVIGIYIAALLFHSILEIGFLNSTTLFVFLIMMLVNGLLRILIFKIKKI